MKTFSGILTAVGVVVMLSAWVGLLTKFAVISYHGSPYPLLLGGGLLILGSILNKKGSRK